MNKRLYLNVPYEQKDEAKRLGAKWDAKLKKWYFSGNIKDYHKFEKWLSSPDIVVFNEIYIIKGTRKCYHCHKPTTIIGIGIGEHSGIYDCDENYDYDEESAFENQDDEIHLAWFDSEDKVPPYLLHYMKSNYNVKTVFSKFRGETCFANCCEHCGSLQGNNYLFAESSPLSTDCDEKLLLNRMEKLDIYTLYFSDALPLTIDISYCSNDWAYSEYCNFHDINDDELSFAEMYGLI